MLTSNTTTDSRIDVDTLITEIVRVCGAMTPIHDSTASFIMFHKHFFKIHDDQIKHLIDTTEYEYRPLETYSRTEDIEVNEGNVRVTDSTVERNESGSGSEDNTNENQVSAYNSDDYVDNSKNIEDKSNSYSSNVIDSGDSTRTDTNKKTEDNYIHGNNGMYSSQQLIEQERNIAQFNIYKWIVDLYSKELFYGIF